MYLYQFLPLYSGYLVLLSHTVSSAPTQPLSSELPSTNTNLSNDVYSTSNKPIEATSQPWTPLNANLSDITTNPSSSSANESTQLQFETVTWPITSTLSLTANIGPWVLNPQRILETLTAANRTVEKKPASLVLDKRFRQETGSRINTLYFEIGPAFEVKRLTWGDVAEVLGEKGLPGFFEHYGYWTSTYFEVMDSVRGKLGEGAVRKWYQLEPPSGGNGTVVGGGDFVVA